MRAIRRFSRKRMPLVLLLCSLLFFSNRARITDFAYAEKDNEYNRGMPDINSNDLISITFKETDLREVLNILAFKGGVNIVAGEDVNIKVTVQLKDVHWEKALDVILKTYDYTYKKEGNLIRVMSLARSLEEEDKVPLVTKIIPLNFADVTELKDSLTKVLSKRGTIEVDKRTNALIVTDVPEMAVKVEQAAMDLDTRTPQVLIEAMMVDVKITDKEEWGTALANLTDNKSPNNGNFLSTNMPGSVVNNFTFSAATEAFDINGVIDIWVKQDKATILASPKVLTLDNQEAKIEIIEQIPYTEAIDTGGGTTINVKFKEAGVKLFVTPHITSGKFISMNVKPEQSFKSGEINSQPIIDSRKAETNLLVRDGQTIVIGGLRQTKDTVTLEKVPFLGDIPFVGLLFKKKIVETIETELVLFVTPHIVFDVMLSDRELELFESLDNSERVVLDQRTEMQKLKDFNDSAKKRFQAKKIAEDEAKIRRKRIEEKLQSSQLTSTDVTADYSSALQIDEEELNALDLEAEQFRQSLDTIKSD